MKTNFNLSKNSVIGLGSAAIAALAIGSFFLVISPQLGAVEKLNTSISEAEEQAFNKGIKLNTLKEESPNISTITGNLQNLATSIPTSSNIGTVGEAVANAIPEGVRLTSFSHGTPVAFAPLTPPAVSLENPAAPFDSAAAPAAPAPTTDADGEPVAPAATPEAPAFQQIPLTITVSASNFEALNVYLDSLSNQPRLIMVQSVVSDSSSRGEIVGTIYAYAYINDSEYVKTWEAGEIQAPEQEQMSNPEESESTDEAPINLDEEAPTGE